jgi:hypothetical protein
LLLKALVSSLELLHLLILVGKVGLESLDIGLDVLHGDLEQFHWRRKREEVVGDTRAVLDHTVHESRLGTIDAEFLGLMPRGESLDGVATDRL